jgi:hypothetical protein
MADTKKNKDWLSKATAKPGGFIEKAKKEGVTPAQLQEMVLSNPEKYDEKTVKQARLRKTLVAIKKKKKD